MSTSNTPNRFSPRGLGDKLRNGRLATTFLVLSALSVGILAGSVLTSNVSGKEGQHIDSSDARPLTIPNPVNLSTSFSQIAKQLGPAVVNIYTDTLPKQSTTKHGKRGLQQGPLQSQPPDGDDGDQGDMQDFLNRFFGGQGGDDDQGGGTRQALGSGFIVDSRGYIITNNHVVDKADHIYVKLSTDPERTPGDPGRIATVIGVDKDTDIAVIKIATKEPLPTVKLGNSDGAQVGDWVLAIGSPFGLSQTVSAGIVSAKNRSIDQSSQTQFQKFIQTDAAINPGNSGGPLVDMSGSVIGMNTAIYTQSMGSEGVGFAMPSNIIINVYNMLIGPDHKVTRGSIGVQFQAAPPSAVSRMYGFSSGGVIIDQIVPGGGAAKAGLEPGDVIVSIDGRQIKGGDDLVSDISVRKVGSTVKLAYLRNGKQSTATVAIGDRSKTSSDVANNPEDETGPAPEVDPGQNKLGITVTAVPPAVATKLGIKSGGVMVASVRSGSFADEITLTKGSVIIEINHKPVSDEASYRSIVSGIKSGDDVVFVVRDVRIQGGGNAYIGGTLP
jgi:serine protease Do